MAAPAPNTGTVNSGIGEISNAQAPAPMTQEDVDKRALDSAHRKSRQSLESLAARTGIPPIQVPRNTSSADAEKLLRLFGRMCRTPEPWLPLGTVGPLIILGHSNPDCRDFWGIPEIFAVKVLLTVDQYQLIREDLFKRLQYKPLPETNALEGIKPPPHGLDAHGIMDWYVQNYPMDEESQEKFRKLISENASVDIQSPTDYKGLPRHMGVALTYLRTKEPIYNPEEAPSQESFPDQLLEKHCVYPMHVGAERIYMLSSDSSIYAFEDEWLSTASEHKELVPVLADPDAIRGAIARNRSKNSTFGAVVDQSSLSFSNNDNIVEIDPVEMAQINPDNPNNTPEQIIHWVLYTAISFRGSDLHVEKYYNTVRFRARIDGATKTIYAASEENMTRFVALIKNFSNMGHQHQDLQDARFAMKIGQRRFDVRVAAVPCRKEQQKIVMRFLDKQDGIKQLSELNMSQRQMQIVNGTMSRDQGLILVTGPTGSGKTTTLYGFINSINEESINIHTIEDPIEYEIEGINQTQTDEFNGINFSTGLRALLRSDPDVILVGESRDEETATAAINSALTGHLVLTTLHANDSLRAVSRLISMGVEPYLLADALALSQAQRLAKKLCTYCKKPVQASRELQEFFYNNGVIKAPVTDPVYEAEGCDECNGSGYHGRVALMEMCPVDAALAEMVAEGAPMSAMRTMAAKSGVLSLYQEGMVQVIAGNTSMKEISKLAHFGVMK